MWRLLKDGGLERKTAVLIYDRRGKRAEGHLKIKIKMKVLPVWQ